MALLEGSGTLKGGAEWKEVNLVGKTVKEVRRPWAPFFFFWSCVHEVNSFTPLQVLVFGPTTDLSIPELTDHVQKESFKTTSQKKHVLALSCGRNLVTAMETLQTSVCLHLSAEFPSDFL